MKNSFSQIFILRKSKRKENQNEIGYLYLRLYINGYVKEYTLRKECKPELWSQKAGRAIGKTDSIKILNKYLETIENKVAKIHQEFVEKNIDFSFQSIINLLFESAEKPRMLVEIYTEHNKQFAALVGKEYAKGTWKRFEVCKKSIEEFILWKYKKSDLNIKDIGFEFIHDYEFYLKTVRSCSHNTVMGYIKKLKKIIRQCVAKNWLDKDPFMNFKITLRETHRTILNEEELKLIATKKFVSKRMEQVRDLFLFSCFTGLAYADVYKLSPSDLVRGIDGDIWIHTTRTKTDTASRIPLLSTAKEIVDKYANSSDSIVKDKLFPIMSNQKMNEYLKNLADVCDIKKELTFHCARHTFATTVTLSNGVPIETVSKMLGHRSLRTTQQYAKVLDRKVSDDMQFLKQQKSLFASETTENEASAV